jgi:23S rRNA (adenine2030-N6)-methyltransferase
MNYRHQFHAGNFAGVFKHVLLVRLLRALQKKEKGYLFLDTHAGRGRYDLELAAAGDSLARQPEWPDGIGRLWPMELAKVPAGVHDYLDLVREFDRNAGNLTAGPRFYPGSPWLAQRLARPVDRLALCELQPAEFGALRAHLGGAPRTTVHPVDGYGALRALLPPAERRALVLIDPPFEQQDEFTRIADALSDGGGRFPTGVYAVWYPLTVRARVDEFLAAVAALNPPAALRVELETAGPEAAIKLRGCGLLVVNPPWQFDREAASVVQFLSVALAQAPGGGGRVEWVVRAP